MLTPELVDQLRADTPSCKKYIHLNNAGAALPPKVVVDVMQQYLKEEATIGGYEIMAARHEELEGFYTAVAEFLNTTPKHVAFVQNSTDGFSKAISSIPFQKGDVILTSSNDYVSNQLTLLSLEKRYGVKIVRGKDLPDGGIDLDNYEQIIKTQSPKLVALTHIPTNTGLVQDVEAVGRICQDKETIYIVDACQSIGQMPVDVQAIGCDFLTTSTRKFLRGPRGGGFMYVSDKVLRNKLAPIGKDLRGTNWTATNEYQLSNTARQFEYWERNYAIVLGIKVAIEYALGVGLDNIQNRIVELADYTRTGLQSVSGARCLDQDGPKGGIVGFVMEGYDSAMVRDHLLAQHINVAAAVRANALIALDREQTTHMVRISPHYYNTKEEVDRCLEVLSGMRNG